MKTYDWSRFTLRIPIKASVKTLYDLWTIPQGLKNGFYGKPILKSQMALSNSSY